MKKKILITSLALCMLSSASAYAQIAVQIGAPVVYAAPAPVYAAPVVVQPYGYGYIGHPWVAGYDPYHRRSDWRYWQNHRGDDHRRY